MWPQFPARRLIIDDPANKPEIPRPFAESTGDVKPSSVSVLNSHFCLLSKLKFRFIYVEYTPDTQEVKKNFGFF